MSLEAFSYLTPEEYLESEKVSPIKHEYIQGAVIAMAGSSDAHVTISVNLVSMIRGHIRGSNCRVYISDMKARVEDVNLFYYPDVMVTCDPEDLELDYFKRSPCLIIEVLSPSTEAYDRGRKFANYRELPSLQEYVMIDQERIGVDCFRRDGAQWVLTSYTAGDVVALRSIGFECPIEDLYEDVRFKTTLEPGDDAHIEVST